MPEKVSKEEKKRRKIQLKSLICKDSMVIKNKVEGASSSYLQNELLLDAISAVDALHFRVRAAVLDDGSLEGDFPFEHGHHEVPIQEGVGLAIR